MKINRLVYVLWLALAVLPLHGQQSRLTGTVSDNTGAVIVGADVAAINLDTGLEYSSQSNEAGVYNFPPLPPGRYELRCEFSGFKSFVQYGLVMETGLTKRLDFQLEVGEVTETVEVTGSAPLLETESSTVGQFIERTTIAQMPVSSRQAGQLVRLAGNITYNSQVGGLYDLPTFSMAGGRSRNQMWHLDGGVVQNMALGIAQLNLNPPVEALQEFKIEATNYQAEYGRSGNGLIIMTTRSGTNDYHGAVYENFRNDKMDARTFFAAEKAALRYNVYGGSIGGPIKKEKSFFFFNFEGQRRHTGRTFAGTDVPRPTEVEGNFSARTDVSILDPDNNKQPFPNKIIPATRIDPIAQAFARFYPAPNVAGNIARAPRNNYLSNATDIGKSSFWTARVDHSFGNNDRAYTRFSYVSAPNHNASITPTEFADSRAGNQTRDNLVWTTNWSHSFTPTTIHEFRFTYGRRTFTNRALGTGSGKNGELGLQGVNQDYFARIDIQGLTRLGGGNQERIQVPIRTFQIVDTLTLIKGNHQIKVGGEWRFSGNTDDFNNPAGGRFGFNRRATNDAFAAFLLGFVNTGQVTDTDILDTRSDYFGFFIQDDWKVTPKLTLNMGLRWEVDTPRWEKSNRQSGFDLNATNPVSGLPGVVTFSGLDGRDRYAHDFDLNNFGPRFGFAYRATNSFVIRGGYGINYNGAYARAVPFTMFNGFAVTGSFSSPDGGQFTKAFQFSDGMPTIQREELTPAFGAVEFGQRPRLAPDYIQANQMNGYAQQWNLTLQKQAMGDVLFEAAYVANVAHKLGGQNVNINMIPLVDGRGPARQSQQLRPFPHFNNVFLETPPWGNSTYHSLNAKVEKRFAGGLNFLANYTWAKFIDGVESANELGGEQGNGYTHYSLRHLDKSLAGNDVRHRFILSGVYELPLGRGRPVDIQSGALNAIAGGWGIGLISELRTGAPYGVLENTNRFNTFAHGQRPNLLGQPERLSNWRDNVKGNTYFDTGLFEAPGAGIIGTSPRNICCGPGLFSFDLSTHKKFALRESLNLELRADFFNLLNRPNFGLPERRRGRADFGTIRGVRGDARTIQLGLRLEF